jgi:ABC-type branched-subunit amino acid transport system ATPase component
MVLPAYFEARGLSKSFGGIHAVSGLDVAVEKGQILGIAGPNGSGKSTFFNILTKVPFGPDKGSVRIDGKDVSSLRAHQIARVGIIRTFQRESVFPALSAIDNVLVASENGPRSGRLSAHVERAAAALDMTGYPASMHNTAAGSLPIFLRKLVMIASALVMEPRVLLLDEPASSLTPSEIERIRALVIKLKAEGLTILLIEHVLPLLTSVSDELIVLDQGRLIASGLPDAVIANPAVVEAYLGKKQ